MTVLVKRRQRVRQRGAKIRSSRSRIWRASRVQWRACNTNEVKAKWQAEWSEVTVMPCHFGGKRRVNTSIMSAKLLKSTVCHPSFMPWALAVLLSHWPCLRMYFACAKLTLTAYVYTYVLYYISRFPTPTCFGELVSLLRCSQNHLQFWRKLCHIMQENKLVCA